MRRGAMQPGLTSVTSSVCLSPLSDGFTHNGIEIRTELDKAPRTTAVA